MAQWICLTCAGPGLKPIRAKLKTNLKLLKEINIYFHEFILPDLKILFCCILTYLKEENKNMSGR